MADDLTGLLARQTPSAARPLQGLTVLLVEDSRFACDAMRLMCLRLGGRIRRADCLASARRHLSSYRPSVVIVDLGLPDGSGLDLITEIAGHGPRVPALIGTSGDTGAADAALVAGVDTFLGKPVESLAAFRAAILSALRDGPAPPVPAPYDDRITPDPLALHDDLVHAADLLGGAADGATIAYLAQFLAGIARSAHDAPLQAAAEALAEENRAGHATGLPVSRISGLVRERLAAGPGF
ncbi:KDP operon transcriptional regulatory protein KdpE [Defluviimonas aquaemixtae]|uniref:KDP operon transcriptional regulatory protein KdpE n=1 Tax=Albidovulum aquaemixtae TaxID=1542388 RepID=A0A2R8BNC8_9RHOB|nr:response regulator [Defluviimonas aquaemixtae]SPH24940.1 KDP operon transcriptional regulatory protein KdpE [Defluviimonas aquaemixtae]